MRPRLVGRRGAQGEQHGIELQVQAQPQYVHGGVITRRVGLRHSAAGIHRVGGAGPLFVRR
jgi:hypothetical protein